MRGRLFWDFQALVSREIKGISFLSQEISIPQKIEEISSLSCLTDHPIWRETEMEIRIGQAIKLTSEGRRGEKFMVQVLGFWVQSLGFRVSDFGFRVWGLRFRV